MSHPDEGKYLEICHEVLSQSLFGLNPQHLGDDCALIQMSGPSLVCQDLFIEDIHFRRAWTSAKDTAYKALAVNLSDVAACNGRPSFATISIALPRNHEEWIRDFFSECLFLAETYEFQVIGGDISFSEKIIVDINLIGASENFLSIKGSQPGNWIAVTGSLGTAKMELELLEQQKKSMGSQRLTRPPIHIPTIKKLSQEYSLSAGTDLSDGLAVAIKKMSSLSNTRFLTDWQSFPVDEEVRMYCAEQGYNLSQWILEGGDDYELLLTGGGTPPNAPELTVIGTVESL